MCTVMTNDYSGKLKVYLTQKEHFKFWKMHFKGFTPCNKLGQIFCSITFAYSVT